MNGNIEDGRGSGERMQVDDHGRAYVLADIISHPAHHATYHQDFFYSYHTTSVPGTSTETPCALVQGINSSLDIELYSVLITFDQAVLMTVYFDSLYSSGGGVVTPRNSNRNSNRTLDCSLYQGGAGADLAVATTNQQLVTEFDLPAGTPFQYPLEGSVILGNDKSILFSATAATAATARITIGITKHPAGMKL